MESNLSKRVGRIEKSAAVDTVAIELGGKTYAMSRDQLRAILLEISEAGADVGPGPSKYHEHER
jgi:hypothetical protein